MTDLVNDFAFYNDKRKVKWSDRTSVTSTYSRPVLDVLNVKKSNHGDNPRSWIKSKLIF